MVKRCPAVRRITHTTGQPRSVTAPVQTRTEARPLRRASVVFPLVRTQRWDLFLPD